MKTRQELRVIATEFLNSSSAEEELRILDKLQVDGAVWAAEKCNHLYYKNIITTALENRAIYAIENKSGAASVG